MTVLLQKRAAMQEGWGGGDMASLTSDVLAGAKWRSVATTCSILVRPPRVFGADLAFASTMVEDSVLATKKPAAPGSGGSCRFNPTSTSYDRRRSACHCCCPQVRHRPASNSARDDWCR